MPTLTWGRFATKLTAIDPRILQNGSLINIQKQEMLIRHLGETETFWFNQVMKLHQLLGQGYQPKDLINIALLFQEVGKSVNNTLKSVE